MRSKRCAKCGEVKPVSGFYRCRTNRDGLQRQCKKCSRAYYEAHREEICANQRAYYKARRGELIANQRAYYEAHREECNAYSRAYREAHREEINANQRAYREAHREEIRVSKRAYHEEHREELLAIRRKREAETRSASREVATRNGEPWTPAEDRAVLAAEGTRLEVALALGRTTESVRQRRTYLRRKAVTA